MKRITSILLALVMTLSLLAVIPMTASADEVIPNMDWGADSDGIYRISNASDMLSFFIFSTDYQNYKDAKVCLTADIDLTGVEWFPLPTFEGTLDGNGFAIKNLTMSGTNQLAFIKELKNATIENIRFVDGSITGTTGDVAVIAIVAKGTCYFKNVYTKMALNLGASNYRASGMLSYANADKSKAVFENCVSECTLSGQRASGFVAQVMVNSFVEMTDCAFIGDLTNAGRWSSAFCGLTTGSASLTRCLSLGKGSTNADTGLFVFLDDQNGRWAGGARYTGDQNNFYEIDSVIKLTDCYAAADTNYPVGLENGSQKRVEFFDFTLNYGGQDTYHLDPVRLANAEAPKTSLLQFENANPANMYLANGATINMTKDNFATVCAGFTNWTVTNETVAYGADAAMVIAKALPTACIELIAGTKAPTTPVVDPNAPAGGEEDDDDDNTVTEPTTEPVTEPTTEPVTEPTTEPTTKAPETNTTTATTTDDERGCASVVGGSLVAILAVACGAATLIRKKED